MSFPRKREQHLWTQSIRNLSKFAGNCVWMYGSKFVGKSTMLSCITYELQQEESPSTKYFYLSLESRENSKEQFGALQDSVEYNAAHGLSSFVIIDAIGPLCTCAPTVTLNEDSSEEEFLEQVHATGEFVRQFFYWVKAKCDKEEASFLF
eukprot:TRINITY_DN1187_c0_g1_i1.p1 TRINITY_DN1187_c0_g1~~TRINITY_DN1187_c0_g1_i1.p1  ORF type:complete len:150 (-),score=18.34 TRINITY_DN1187_c0_g1_i1:432-881(-)